MFQVNMQSAVFATVLVEADNEEQALEKAEKGEWEEGSLEIGEIDFFSYPTGFVVDDAELLDEDA